MSRKVLHTQAGIRGQVSLEVGERNDQWDLVGGKVFIDGFKGFAAVWDST
jgi:hypothetical protein